MPKAIWNGKVIAEAPADKCVTVEGNRYFPVEAVDPKVLQPSDTHTTCPWKGLASYFNIVVGGKTNNDAAWYYPDPSPAAAHIKGRVAFWKGIDVQD
jgi:uncharacterized protein (DUF427 family)